MKRMHIGFIAMVMMIAVSEAGFAQKMAGLDQSPADIALLRTNGKKGDPVIKVIYGRPQKKGRTMLGGTEPYGKVWRTGANESTEIKFYKDVTFGDKKVTAGTYTLYSIPDKSEWTIILNSKLDTWGAYEYEEGKDVIRIKVPAGKTDGEIEAFTIDFDGANGGSATMRLAWENTLVQVPVKY